MSPLTACGYQRFCSDLVYDGSCSWGDHDYTFPQAGSPCDSEAVWPQEGGPLCYNSSSYCDSLDLESQNITDITMSQLSQLAPVCEDILSSALQQTILGQQEDSSSSYSANSPYSPDSHNGELEPP